MQSQARWASEPVQVTACVDTRCTVAEGRLRTHTGSIKLFQETKPRPNGRQRAALLTLLAFEDIVLAISPSR